MPRIRVDVEGGPQHATGEWSGGQSKCWETNPRHVAMEIAFSFTIENPLRKDVEAVLRAEGDRRTLERMEALAEATMHKDPSRGRAIWSEIHNYLKGEQGKKFQSNRRYLKQTGTLGWNMIREPPPRRPRGRIEFKVDEYFELFYDKDGDVLTSCTYDEHHTEQPCNWCALQGDTSCSLEFGTLSAAGGGGLLSGFTIASFFVSSLENGKMVPVRNPDGSKKNQAGDQYGRKSNESVEFKKNSEYPVHKWGYLTDWIDHCPCQEDSDVIHLGLGDLLSSGINIYRGRHTEGESDRPSGPTIRGPVPLGEREAPPPPPEPEDPPIVVPRNR